ncbi:V-type ATPase subunit [Athalassotoga saccharophila]|uniref:V-type ATPase subunit n=1 Tax=Athalassotoga saccharophila TaxID=1441386 RepID=UPI0013798550|nr:V-type ATPase subunit [Athalassotoga saccharophila]BBJ27397.1 V-type ATP synthase subunit C [Athalassotoga saccharophila]
MIGFVKYGGISAKLYALSGNLLNEDDYKNLLNQKSVPDIVRYLQSTRMYADTLGNINADQVHRRDLENLLAEDLLKDMKKIFSFFVTFDRNFMHLLFYRYEIENLKIAIRGALSKAESDIEEIKKRFFDLGERSTFDPLKVLGAKNQDEILDALSGTPYQEVLRNAFSSYKQTSPINLIAIVENALDSWLLSKIISASKNLGSSDQAIVKEIEGERADITDIEWLLRVKAFYDLKPEEAYNSLLPFHFRLRPDHLHAMCDSKGLKELVDVIKEGPYANVYKELTEENALSKITLLGRRYLRSKAKASITKLGNFSIATYFHYFLLKEFEIMDISTITEGVRYGIKPDEIRERLVIRL